MKSLNMQISAASASLVGANLPQVSSLGAGPVSHLPEREFSIRGLCCCLCTAPAAPKEAGFSWEKLLPGSVHAAAEKGASPRGPASPRSGWEMLSLCFYPSQCFAERPERELTQHLQPREGRECLWAWFWHPELTRSQQLAMDAGSRDFCWILAPLSPWIAGDGAAVLPECSRSTWVLQAALGNKYKGKHSPSSGPGACMFRAARAWWVFIITVPEQQNNLFPAWKK